MRTQLLLLILLLTLRTVLNGQTITDSFSDGDFTSNPTWIGDVDNFQVVTPHTSGDGSLSAATDGNVLGSKPNVGSSVLLVETNRAYGQWSFSATDGRTWSISSTNDYFFVLCSDTNDPNAYKGTLNFNGYYLRFDGSIADKFVLYRQQGTTRTEVINTMYPASEDGTSSIPRSFRILRTSDGTWSIFIDEVWGQNATTMLGTAIDNTITAGQYFGIVTRISSPSAARVVWFDNFYCGEIVYDTTPPTVVAVTASGPNTILVEFSEAVTSESALNVANYLLLPTGVPTEAVFVQGSQNKVRLSFSQSFPLAQPLTLYVSGVADLSNNVITPSQHIVFYTPPQPGDVLINEIFFDPSPSVGLPDYDFLELYNRKSYPVNIGGWKLTIGTKNITLPNYTMPANSYLILAPSVAYNDYSAYGTVLTLISTTDLPTTGGAITLKDTANQLIHYVSYNLSFYQDPSKEEGGWSIELIDPNNWCQHRSNWRASVASIGGTPGSANSVLASNPDNTPPSISYAWPDDAWKIRVVFSEQIPRVWATNLPNYQLSGGIGISSITYDSVAQNVVVLNLSNQLPLSQTLTLTITNIADYCGNVMPTAQVNVTYYPTEPGDVLINEIFFDPSPSVGLPDYDYLELYNRRSYSVNISGWKLTIGTRDIPLPSYLMPANSYLILTSSGGVSEYSQYGPTLGLLSTSDLPTTGREIKLMTSTSMIVHYVSYDILFYQDPTKEEGGWSIELIDPESWCQHRSNWRASVASIGGTPGSANSVLASNPDDTPPSVISVWASNARKIGILFSEQIPLDVAMNPERYQLFDGLQIQTLEYDPIQQNLVTITITGSMELERIYRIAINGITDYCGNLMETQEFEFLLYLPTFGFVVFNEIMCNPKTGAALPNVPYIELFNPNPFPVNLNQWVLKSGTTSYTIPPSVIDSMGYLLLRPYSSDSIPGVNAPQIPLFSSTFLSKSGKTLELQAGNGTLVHWVSYSDTWYKDNFKQLGGWSLEQIDPMNFCAGGNNWRASNDSTGGTPGRINSVFGNQPDIVTPKVMFLTVDSDTTITLHFNEPLLWSSVTDITLWSVSPGGFPLDIIPNSPSGNAITIKLREPIQENVEYTLIPPQHFDCVGNSITPEPMRFYKPSQPLNGDLIINELLFNSYSGGNKFVELYNRSTKILTINKIYLTRQKNEGEYDDIKLASNYGFLIYPDEYLVLTTSRKGVYDFYPNVDSIRLIEVSSLPSMSISSGNIVILDMQGNIIDQIFYDEKMHSPLLRNVKGVSLERINPDGASDDQNNWQSAAQTVGYATPGYKNSQTIVPTASSKQFFLSSEVFSPDGDGYHDFLLINYQLANNGYFANIKIFEPSGRLIKDLVTNYSLGTQGAIKWDGTDNQNKKAPMGPYLIFIEYFNSAGDKKVEKIVVTLSHRK
ncbi:MAG TPA: lamin tail domain-containing protein [Salinivirgaceae bacterium]|nr:lamin tail domain-containing protein [Salinivirgaceae bacterium]